MKAITKILQFFGFKVVEPKETEVPNGKPADPESEVDISVDDLVDQHHEQMEDLNEKTSLYNDWKNQLAEKRQECSQMRNDAVSDIIMTGDKIKRKTKELSKEEAAAKLKELGWGAREA